MAVTFDCWNTLMAEVDPDSARSRRTRVLLRTAREAGLAIDTAAAGATFDNAWREHQRLWGEGIGSGSREIAGWALESLGIEDPTVHEAVALEFENVSLEQEQVALQGARETLAKLRERGLRVGLICDTGFSPGRVVRQLLGRLGLLDFLEVAAFSNEIGAPKPDARMFSHALSGLGAAAEDTLHVGDLRHTDVAGARAAGMASVRIRDTFDDHESPHPEADHIVDHHGQLQDLLKL